MRRALGVVLLTAAGMIPLRVIATPVPESLSRDKALLLMRVVIATEATLASTKKEYGNLIDLVQSPAFPDASERTQVGLPAAMDVIDSSSAQLADYVVRITTSEDKKHFQASLVPNDPKTCGPALFSDDKGLIYGGKVLGCQSSGPLR